MFEFAKVYVRSLVFIIASTVTVCYLGLVDPVIIGGYFASGVAVVLLDDAHSSKERVRDTLHNSMSPKPVED